MESLNSRWSPTPETRGIFAALDVVWHPPRWCLIVFIVSLCLLGSRKRRAMQQEEEHRRHEALSRKRAAEAAEKEQRALALSLTNLVSDSAKAAKSLPDLTRSAERAIDVAEREFDDGAFAPFWDAIEQAAHKLATFESTIQQLIRNSTVYKSQASKVSPPPPFQLGLDTLPDATDTAERMRSVVRRAQKNFQFATIYEQRKTNQLLVVGFSTLGQAINELGARLESSLDTLGSSVSIAISDASSQIASEIELSREQAAQDAAAQRQHDSQEREMLDNIQHRRKPFP